LRLEIARRIGRVIGNRQKYWRGCKERTCRRARACQAPRIHCSSAPPVTPSSPERLAHTMALVQRTLREIIARKEAGEGK
jgi:hypothetical protein